MLFSIVMNINQLIISGTFLVASYACGVSGFTPCACARDYDPVCGNDNHTYPNLCIMTCIVQSNADLKLKHPGDCNQTHDTCKCSGAYQPVCGSDGLTYPNMCMLYCVVQSKADLKLKHRGNCNQPPDTSHNNKSFEFEFKNELELCKRECPDEINHVCGSDGHTYPNYCVFACAVQSDPNLKLKHRGDCEPTTETSCICPDEYKPVCGSDGNTYPNKCMLECAVPSNPDLRPKYPGPCEEVPANNQCTVLCPDEYYPVCGSDGVTYPNRCMLECALPSNPELWYEYPGVCREVLVKKPCIDFCPNKYDPVCGSDDHTYANDCLFKCAVQTTPDLMVNHPGACKPTLDTSPYNTYIEFEGYSECITDCPDEYNLVCGSDDHTYHNYCMFMCTLEFDDDLWLKHPGDCKQRLPTCDYCGWDYNPVCGSDGHTYPNECLFTCVEGSIPNLELKHHGHCNRDLCICLGEYKPVCGSDGKTYLNQCVLGCEQRINLNLRKEHGCSCKRADGSDSKVADIRYYPACTCPTNMRPVCGSNRITYTNICSLKCAVDTTGDYDLEKEADGPCEHTWPN